MSGSLFGRLAVGIVLGFLLLHLIASWYWAHEHMVVRAQTVAVGMLDRALALHALSEDDVQIAIEHARPDLDVQIVAQKPAPPPNRWSHNDEIVTAVRQHLSEVAFAKPQDVRVGFSARRGEGLFTLILPYRDRWMVVTTKAAPPRSGHVAGVTLMTVLAFVILFAVLLATRRVTRHLSRFADAANAVGKRRSFPPLPENQGPREVRDVSAALNRMQTRVVGLLQQRTQMLGAVSHDLRTIATRLNLRIVHIEDETQHQKAMQDLEEMSIILEEALVFARDEVSDEPISRVDLGSMLESLVHDEQDLGQRATISVPSTPVLVEVQAVAVKRAFSNLLKNALQYGGEANVRLQDSGEVTIADPGPGIDEAELDRLLQPFARGEQSRNRETGGTGLGLAIAKNVIERHGGQLQFVSHADGFEVRVQLPRA